MTENDLWDIARYILIPVIVGIIGWLWKLDQRIWRVREEAHKREVDAERRYVSRETFDTVVAKIEKALEAAVLRLEEALREERDRREKIRSEIEQRENRARLAT